MIHHPQFMPQNLATNTSNRKHQPQPHQRIAIQQQQDSSSASTTPQSDQSRNSMSTSSPPHQVSSRVSPASTALVMSSNNISQPHQQQPQQQQPQQQQQQQHHHQQQQHQSQSRGQIWPSNNSTNTNGHHHHNHSASNGNNSSSNHAVHQQQPHHQHHNQQQQQHQHPLGPPPNPMIRQFACHTKSMSAGVVVSVPGISNNLATTAGMQQHNQVVNQHNFVNSQTAAALAAANQAASVVGSHHQNHHHHTHHRQSGSHHGSRNNSTHFPTHVNSIWSIDENISKSYNKLASSNHLSHSYLFNPSIGELSCDNVSNVGRLAPAPAYYLHNQPSATLNPKLSTKRAALASTHSLKTPEFLPICDLIFNLISMIIYFCENTFNIIALIALYYHAPNKYWSLIGAAFVAASNFICQPMSFKWIYKMKLEECKRKRDAHEELEDEEKCGRRYHSNLHSNYPCGSSSWLPDGATEVQVKFFLSIVKDATIHLFCLGFLARYIMLVIPVKDITRVKKEARDLCFLRMIQAFVQSAPLLLLLTYMVGFQNGTASITNLCIISAVLSLLNICWALASFTKYARKKFMHKFVLTWLGIVSQLLWRLGTVSSRVAALSVYAVHYNYWMLIMLSLHWFTMFLWLFKPGNLLRDEVNIPKTKKLAFAIGAAWIYCFCYVNFEEHNSRAKMGLYYLIMFVENNLLFTVCQTFSTQVTWFKTISILVVYLGFAFGMLFMFLYYKYFHVTVLNNGISCSQESIDSIADQLSPAGKKIAGFKPGTLKSKKTAHCPH